MRNVWMLILLLAPLAWAQDDESPPAEEATEEAAPPAEEGADEKKEEDKGELLTATELRQKVRTARKNVLVGGPAVVQSEKEALKFYRKKLNQLATRADELRTQRDVKESEYDLALDTSLNAKDEAERQQALRQASKLRAEMADLDTEIALLDKQGETLGKGLGAIRKRMEQRKRLMTRFDRPEYVEDLPFLADGLLEIGEEEGEAGDPFGDEALIDDLIARDPARARSLLFGQSPELYWRKFPLTPPRSALKHLLKFPDPDLPGNR